MAVAGVGAADVIFRFLQHASVWRRHYQRELDRDRWPLCGRVSFCDWKDSTLPPAVLAECAHSAQDGTFSLANCRHRRHLRKCQKSKIVEFASFQPTNVTDPHPRRRIRFLAHPRGVSVRGKGHRAQSRPSQIQFLHVRIRPGAGEAGVIAGICPAHRAHLPTRHRWPAHRPECDRLVSAANSSISDLFLTYTFGVLHSHSDGLGSTIRGRHIAVRAAGGAGADCEQRPLQNDVLACRPPWIHTRYIFVRRPWYRRTRFVPRWLGWAASSECLLCQYFPSFSFGFGHRDQQIWRRHF